MSLHCRPNLCRRPPAALRLLRQVKTSHTGFKKAIRSVTNKSPFEESFTNEKEVRRARCCARCLVLPCGVWEVGCGLRLLHRRDWGLGEGCAC